MLFALFTAPLFHVHEDDDHDHSGTLVHAHLPEPEEELPHSEPAVEYPHSHENVRWLDDVLSVSGPVITVVYTVADVAERFTVSPSAVTREFLPVQSLYSHSPPERSRLLPRSPPTI
jgi:hypothetical protein